MGIRTARVRSIVTAVFWLASLAVAVALGKAAYYDSGHLGTRLPRLYLGLPAPDSPEVINVAVTIDRFNFGAGGGSVDGHASVTARSSNAKPLSQFKPPRAVVLSFHHVSEKTTPVPATLDVKQGGSVDIIQLKHITRDSASGEGKLTWDVATVIGPWLYPFDRYILFVKPRLTEVSPETGAGPDAEGSRAITTFDIDVRVPIFMSRCEGLGGEPCTGVVVNREEYRDQYQIILERPMLLMAMTWIFGGLAALFLVYLVVQRDIGSVTWQGLGFFGTVWGIRSMLVTSAPLFPVVVDFVALGVYVVVALILIFKVLTRVQW